MRYYLRPWDESRGDKNDSWGHSLWYFEVDPEGNVFRQLEAYESGKVLRYDQSHPEDEYGQLASHSIDDAEYAPFLISSDEFENRWTFPEDHTEKRYDDEGRVYWVRPESGQ